MRRHRFEIVAALALIFVLLLTGCDRKLSQMSPAEITAQVLKLSGAQDMVRLSDAQIANSFDFAQGGIQAQSVYVSEKDGCADEIAVFAARSQADIPQICGAVTQYITARESGMKQLPNEYRKLQNKVLCSAGNNVILVVSGGSQQVQDTLASMGAVPLS